ncbi:alpha/beta fold hydrolase [Brevundimonas sp. NPDC092305]|uniref:alpha/beta fold hydrolase n=1 Tax=Brevundimonas sp. NPDC092305 TaxID=3363957 RepID=UPI0038156F34
MNRRDFILGLGGGVALGVAEPAWAQTGFRSSRIAVEIRGAGPDVILIPGIASTSEVWAGVVQRLRGRRIHLISVKGFGALPGEANVNGPVMGPVANEVRRYIAEARLNRPAVVGHSMGGQIGLRAAADGRDQIGRLMTVDASPFFPALISPGATVGDVQPIAQLAYGVLQFLGDEALVARSREMGVELGGATDSLFSAIGWQGGDRQVLAQSLYEVMTVDLRHRLPDITAPVTVVYGWSPDDASPRHEADRLFRSAYAALRRPATFERIEGAEHMVMIDQPARFMASLNRFLI